ncbi:MAG: membrane integrity-associated transporter subunit PqiC [Alphaproteobacteria bacterium]|nr:membrane integrity-associated transporter subunit PqiC [Alphaproteobacteria bacterium]MCW5744385.1 membrane integrity-associated transporter subunit PqiC [Alphaproteobacteria bacterium]
MSDPDSRIPRRVAAAVAFAALLGACSLLDKADDPVNLFTVTPKSTFDAGLPMVRWQLIVETPTAAAHLNSGRIALQMTPTSSDYYAQSAWIDRAPLMVQTRTVESFENTKRIVGVGRDPVAVKANYILQTDLREFQAEYFHGGAPIVHVRIIARLVRMPDRQIVGAAAFERCWRARADKIPEVVKAFDEALGSVLKRLVAWTLTAAPPHVLPDGVPSPAPRGGAAGVDNSAGCPKPGQNVDTPVVQD